MESNAERVQKVLDFLNGVQTPEEIVEGVSDDPKQGSSSAEAYGVRRGLAEKILDTRGELPNQRFISLKQVVSVYGLGDDTLHDIFMSLTGGPPPAADPAPPDEDDTRRDISVGIFETVEEAVKDVEQAVRPDDGTDTPRDPPVDEPVDPSRGSYGKGGWRMWLPPAAMTGAFLLGWILGNPPITGSGDTGSGDRVPGGPIELEERFYSFLDNVEANNEQALRLLAVALGRLSEEPGNVELEERFYTDLGTLVANNNTLNNTLVANNDQAVRLLAEALDRWPPEPPTGNAEAPLAFEHRIQLEQAGDSIVGRCLMEDVTVLRRAVAADQIGPSQ